MNHTFRVLWNDRLAAWVAVPETARAQGKPGRTRKPLAALLAALGCSAAFAAAPAPTALPEGGTVVAGSATINQSGARMDVTQTTDRAILEWNRFDIGSAAHVHFAQPAATSVALNRVLAGEASRIHGTLTATGQVYLVNPAGVLFGPGSRVDVGGLVATSMDIADDDFMAGRDVFRRNGALGKVVNQGEIKAADGGLIALLAPEAINEGVISARFGNVVLAAGERITLEAGAGGHLHVAVDPATVSALVDNRHLVQADGGQVVMSAQAADTLLSAVVANSGTVQARTLANRAGRILLLADMTHGEVRQHGLLDASAPESGDGGFIETSAAKVGRGETARVTTLAANGQTGTWLIDPNDYTIAASGGDITGAQLSTDLGSTHVVIESADGATNGNGDIFVRDNVTWTSGNRLTLSAIRNIEILATLDASGGSGGKVTLEYGQGAVAAGNTATYHFGLTGTGFTGKINLQAGANFSTKLGSNGSVVDYTVITNLGAAGSTTGTDLQGMNGNLAGNYVLGADIDASVTSGWNAGAGWMPVGDVVGTNQFSGRFDGIGHTVSNLTINRSGWNYLGLFGMADNASIRNVGLSNASITGQQDLGVLAGVLQTSLVDNVWASGSVSSTSDTVSRAGGLVGMNLSNSNLSQIYADVSVSGSGSVGGLIGLNYGTVSQSYATGGVSGGGNYVGGLIGHNNSGTVSQSYATGSVNGTDHVGGLLGSNTDGTISNSYATGAVTGSASWIGGLVGSSSTGSVVNSSYWDTQTTGQATSAGGTGKTTAEMKQLATFSGWDIDDAGGTGKVWRIYEGQSAPLLRGFLTPLTVTADADSKTYDAVAYSGGNGVTYSDLAATPSGAVSYSGTAQGAVNAGSYAITPGGLYSNQQGYDITFANGTLTIDPRAITVTASDQSRAYGSANPTTGATTVTTGTLAGADALGTATLTAAGTATATANAATTHALTPSVQTFGTGSAANYTITYANGTLTITAAPLTVTANNASKTYDGLAWTGNNGVSYSGFRNGETSAVLGGALAWGGTAEGALAIGSYSLIPSGLTAGNYTITFVNGVLTITAVPPAPTFADNQPDGGQLSLAVMPRQTAPGGDPQRSEAPPPAPPPAAAAAPAPGADIPPMLLGGLLEVRGDFIRLAGE